MINLTWLSRRVPRLALRVPLIFLCAGAAASLVSSAGAQSATPVPLLTGVVSSDQIPLAGATVTLYGVNALGYGKVSPVLAGPVVADAQGTFTINAPVTCPAADTLVYLIAQGGNPGLSAGAQNPSAMLMATPGLCSTLSPTQPVIMNELSTIMSIWPIAPYMSTYKSIGYSANGSATFAAAYTQAQQMSTMMAALQTQTTVTGAALVAQKRINMLANTLVGCVRSTGGVAGDGSPCGKLFTEVLTISSLVVSNTVDAALQIAKYPTVDAAGIYHLAAAKEEYLPAMIMPPTAWIIGSDVTSLLAANSNIPTGSSFTPPAANACQSKYDQFYASEPGVYAYWALCEAGSPMQIFDYVGAWDLTSASGSFGSGVVTGGAPGPVPDGETAAFVTTAQSDIESQDIPLNANQGTIAGWINGNAEAYPLSAVFFSAIGGKSGLAVSISSAQQQLCFIGSLTNAAGTAAKIQSCGYAPNTWHRVAFTWSNGNLVLAVDGTPVANGTYTGTLDQAIFFYRLFSGCCAVNLPMEIAKVSVANNAWNTTQIATDSSHALAPVPAGGVYVSTQTLGTIHGDILGYADNNQNITTSATTAPLISGLGTAGVTSLRYASGYGGISADLGDWQGGPSCTSQSGVTVHAAAKHTNNTLDTYLPGVVHPLKLHVIYTVNYGSNPPYCDAGGDPVINGANLVNYTNVQHNYDIKRWEIGNEQYSGTTEPDFHPNPNTGTSYGTYEPAFYAAMKAVDPTIQISVPVSMATYDWATKFTLPVLSNANYDAVSFHSYMMRDPITDGQTLYSDRVSSNVSRVKGELLGLQTTLLSRGKNPDAIWITEWNGEVLGDKWSKQTAGAVSPLFAAMQLGEYMEAGVQVANWWEQGATDVCSTLDYDSSAESSYSWWECGSTSLAYTGAVQGVGELQVGLQPGDITPVARAFQLLSESGFVTEGEHMLRTFPDQTKSPWLASFAATHGGSYAVILINRDRDTTHTIPVALAGVTAGTSVEQWTYGRQQYDATRFGDWTKTPTSKMLGPWTGAAQVSLPPWSVSVLVFN